MAIILFLFHKTVMQKKEKKIIIINQLYTVTEYNIFTTFLHYRNYYILLQNGILVNFSYKS